MWRIIKFLILQTSHYLEVYFPILLLYIFLFVIIPYQSGGITQLIETNGVTLIALGVIWIFTHVFRSRP